ncbi:MAG: type II secretion system F family protein, partial [Planctomycetota bacterium]
MSALSTSTFRYTALDAHGSRSTGTVEATSKQAACAELERRSLTPLDVQPTKARRSSTGPRVGQATLARSYTQMADLLRAGVPLLRAIRVLGRSKSEPKSAAVFTQVASAVESGDDLADAMAQH